MADSVNEVDRNYLAFEKALPSLLQSHPGKFALMHNAQIVEYFDSASVAVGRGLSNYGPDGYSVQEIISQADDLGFYSYAGGALQA